MNEKEKNIDLNFLKDNFLRYFSFYPFFILSVIIFLSISLIYLRYADIVYSTTTSIEIIDKANDSEMVLPTSMTIFNRSMINLENEIEVLKSHKLVEEVVVALESNIKYYSVGRVRTTENHESEWLNADVDYNLKLTRPLDSIIGIHKLIIDVKKNGVEFDYFFDGEIVGNFDINGYTISESIIGKKIPFELNIDDNQIDKILNNQFILEVHPLTTTVQSYIDLLQIIKVGKQSDLLSITYKSTNPKLAEEFLNALVSKFDMDGIIDRQLIYKRTIDFVDSRYELLKNELDLIEDSKQRFKKDNKLSYIEADAVASKEQRLVYNSQLFESQSQLDLAKLLESFLSNNENKYMPVNIGLEDAYINELIKEYNLIISERNKFELSTGSSNSYIVGLDNKINNMFSNVLLSIENYKKSLELTIDNIKSKEFEYEKEYTDIPENERLLRSIEREQEIKEALFLLLLQKREEAAINFAVTKPSIKIIDYAITSIKPVSPNRILILFLSLFLGVIFPFIILYIWFLIDSKIHTRKQISDRLDIPIVGEVPHIKDKKEIQEIVSNQSRNPLAESIRMIIANLNFVLFNDDSNKSKKRNIILVTSSIKGEGKTIVSANTASILASKYKKVLLIGADLRNPQIHKFIGIDKSIDGISDYIYRDSDKDWRKFIINSGKLDIILSGTIPPNPTELIASKKFENFINQASAEYDYIIIDSAPCLLVSDTFEISKHVDTTIYVIRSNHSDIKLFDFIDECKKQNKLPNINLVLNSVGNSSAYGYKYDYQYGYKYGYKYGYNYGYGYGYSEDSN